MGINEGTPGRDGSLGEGREAIGLVLGLLGTMNVRRGGGTLELPPSRKARALLAYLALAAGTVSRRDLCEIFWEGLDDPRAELRWVLSRIRQLVDDARLKRLATSHDGVRIDLRDATVDAEVVNQAAACGFATLAFDAQRALLGLFRGEFLAGLELDDSPIFNAWITAQRQRFRSLEVALLEQLVRGAQGDAAAQLLERWRRLAPFDRRVHELLLGSFARRNQLREGEEHLAAASRLFAAEGLDTRPLRAAWDAARSAAASRGVPATVVAPLGVTEDSASGRRVSVAVMPFAPTTPVARVEGGLGTALAHDVITRLAKLRSLFVIAQGTTFALAERDVGAEQAARMLGVDYVATGTYHCAGGRVAVAVELIETRTARVLWAETLAAPLQGTLQVLDEVGDRIVSAVAQQIEAAERNRAILKPPGSLDAWEAHHRGLWHMYRFSREDNTRARGFFATAIRLDPTFSRAHAGLSFTYFQDAFQGWAPRDAAIARAFASAGAGLLSDDRDPSAHWAMGRALWLQGRGEQAVGALRQAVELAPSFALGHYTIAFVNGQAGDPEAAIRAADLSRSLSPFDPLLFGMLAVRAFALVRLERFDEAADWAAQAAARPNAHAHILGIAAFTLALAGSKQSARAHVAAVHRSVPGYGIGDLLAAFRFDPAGERLFRRGARLLGGG